MTAKDAMGKLDEWMESGYDVFVQSSGYLWWLTVYIGDVAFEPATRFPTLTDAVAEVDTKIQADLGY